MKSINFIIASKSYLINKGIAVVLNELRNAKLLEIVEEASQLKESVQRNKPDFAIVSTEILCKMDVVWWSELYTMSPNTQVIHLKFSELKKKTIVLHHPDLNIQWGRTEIQSYMLHLLQNDSNEDQNELSEREETILKNVAMGKTNKEIAEDLFLSIHTVITHRKNITSKLGIKSISGLTVYAIMNGLISIEEVE